MIKSKIGREVLILHPNLNDTNLTFLDSILEINGE